LLTIDAASTAGRNQVEGDTWLLKRVPTNRGDLTRRQGGQGASRFGRTVESFGPIADVPLRSSSAFESFENGILLFFETFIETVGNSVESARHC